MNATACEGGGRRRRAAAALAGLLAVSCAASGSSPSAVRGITEDPPARLPRVVLTDTAGAPFDLAARARGRLTYLVFGYTSCPDVCPTQMAALAVALRGVPAGVRERVLVVFVTTDPDRDTPQALREWLDRFDPAFVGLRGTPEQVHAAERQAGLPESAREERPDGAAGTYGVAHAAKILAYTPDGLAHVSYLDGTSAADIGHDIPLLLRGRPTDG
jgi:protein SCO1/2